MLVAIPTYRPVSSYYPALQAVGKAEEEGSQQGDVVRPRWASELKDYWSCQRLLVQTLLPRRQAMAPSYAVIFFFKPCHMIVLSIGKCP